MSLDDLFVIFCFAIGAIFATIVLLQFLGIT